MRSVELSAILAIGHDTSLRGVGISLREALTRARYTELRGDIRFEDIVEAIRERPELKEQWIMYCEDKRTSGGWYIDPNRLEVGQIGKSKTSLTFDTLEEAVASFVLHELDFWSRRSAA